MTPRDLTDDDIDALLVPVRDIAKLIAQAACSCDAEIRALRRIVAEQELLILQFADDIAPSEQHPMH